MGLWRMLKGEEPGPIETIKNFQNTGQWGEYLTEYLLNEKHIEGTFKVFTNTLIPHKNNKTEIDVFMVHEKGVFVFESKNYSGWIFGTVDQKQWTQTLKNGKKNRFYNPLLQNKTHINALSEYLSIPKDRFLSYIVFSERCTLKEIPSPSNEYTILRRHHLLKNVQKTLANRPVVFDEMEVGLMCTRIDLLTQNEADMVQHIERVKGYSDGMTCPYCGGELVERSGKKGAFIGCKNFPKCRFTRDK